MATSERRLRERSAQRQLIVRTARLLAEQEGWSAVTTRRLSAHIEYSQPVIYKHFTSLDDLAEAVALEGFDELAKALGEARRAAPPEYMIRQVAFAYTSFADENPALYDVMFTRATGLPFGSDDPPTPLAAAYAELRAAIAPTAVEPDVETLTEVIWAALHGLVMLSRSGRLRTSHHRDRIDLLVDQFGGGESAGEVRRADPSKPSRDNPTR